MKRFVLKGGGRGVCSRLGHLKSTKLLKNLRLVQAIDGWGG